MIGRHIGDYVIEDLLGQGAFGTTYRARRDSDVFALKVFRPEAIRTDVDEARIEREIRALQRIDHVRVAKYVDAGSFSEAGRVHRYVVIEFVPGYDLGRIIEREGALDSQHIRRLAIQIIEGIEAIYAARIVHRDLKPSNIMVTPLGDVKIVDVGLAKFLDYSSITQTGYAVGTLAYCSPEELTAGEIDFRADLYSLGVVLFQLSTGRLPFEAGMPALINQILNEVPPLPSSINSNIDNRLENIILQLLMKEPSRRYNSMGRLKRDLSRVGVEVEIEVPPPILRGPAFLARVMQNEAKVLQTYLTNERMDGIIYQANFCERWPRVVQLAMLADVPLLIDPCTYRLAYTGFSSTVSLRELPYVKDPRSRKTPEHFRTLSDIQNTAVETLKWQMAHGANILVAPFHFLRSPRDEWWEVDDKLLREARQFVNDTDSNLLLLAGVAFELEGFASERDRARLVNKLTRVPVEGYLIYPGIERLSTNQAQIYTLARIVRDLTRTGGTVIVCRVGAFGLGLLAIGATAITSGLSSLDSFGEALLKGQGPRYRIPPRYYVPGLLSMVNTPTLHDILWSTLGQQLVCRCTYCDGRTDAAALTTFQNSRLHYLYWKMHEVTAIRALEGEEDRLAWFQSRVNEAHSLVRNLRRADIDIRPVDYLRAWAEILSDVVTEG